MFFLLLFLGLTAIHATVTVDSNEYNSECKTLDSDIRKFILNDPTAYGISTSQLMYSMEICGKEYIHPTTLTLAALESYLNLFSKMLAIGVPITEPALIVRYFSEFGDYEYILALLYKNPTRTQEFELAMNNAIETLGCSRNPYTPMDMWTNNVNKLSSKFYGKSEIWKGWHRVLMSASQCNQTRVAQYKIVEHAIINAKELLSISAMEEVLKSALKFKNRKMITLIEEKWPEIIWERLSPSIIRSTMDIELLKKIQMHWNPYLSSMKYLMPAYSGKLQAEQFLTDEYQISDKYWKAVGYILGSHLQQFEMFWTELKKVPNSEDNYFSRLVVAACLAENQEVAFYLLQNPPLEKPIDVGWKYGIAQQLLSVPETIHWLNFGYLPDVYCSLAEPNVTYETRLVLMELYQKALKTEGRNELRMTPSCYNNLKDMKEIDLISDLLRRYRSVRLPSGAIPIHMFYQKYLVDGNYFLKIHQECKKRKDLYRYLIDNEKFDFVVGAIKAELFDLVKIIAFAFKNQKDEFAFRLMKKFNISNDAVLAYAEKKKWKSVTTDFALNLWGKFQP